MKKFTMGLFALALLVSMTLVGCGGGLTEKKVGEMWDAYFAPSLAAVKKGEAPADPTKTGDEIAKKEGFKDWNDFATKAATTLGAEKWTKATQDASTRYQEAMKKAIEEKTSGAGAGDNKPK